MPTPEEVERERIGMRQPLPLWYSILILVVLAAVTIIVVKGHL